MEYREKLQAYIERAFRDLPHTEAVQSTKEELMADLLDHYESYRSKGVSPEQAYQSALGSIGNIFELLDALEAENAAAHALPDRAHASDHSISSREVSPFSGRWQPFAVTAAGVGCILLLLYAGGVLQTGPGPHHGGSLPVAIALALIGLIAGLYFGLVRRERGKQTGCPWLLGIIWGAAALSLVLAWQKPHLHRTLWLIPVAALAAHLLVRYCICSPNHTGHST